MDCSGLKGSAVSHKDSSDKSNVALKWMIPKGLTKDQKIVFKATVVQEFSKYFSLAKTISNLA
jgi:hypothetical protein